MRRDAERSAAIVTDGQPGAGPELSICIPTHGGRAAELATALDSIIDQLDGENRGRAEVCIADNASADETAGFVHERQVRRPGLITYVRHRADVGASRNVMAATDLASGRWIWPFGSDDALEPGSIAEVLALLSRHPEVAGLSMNRRLYRRDLRTLLGIDEVRLVPPPATLTCLRGAGLLEALGLYAMYMSGHIVSAAAWRDARARLDRETLEASIYPQTWVLTRIWLDGVEWLWDPDRRIRSRIGNSSFGVDRELDYAALLERTVRDQAQIWRTLIGRRRARRQLARLHDLLLPPDQGDHLIFSLLCYEASPVRSRARLLMTCARSFGGCVRFWRESLRTLLVAVLGSVISATGKDEVAESLTRMRIRVTPERRPLTLSAGVTYVASFLIVNVGAEQLRSRPGHPMNVTATWVASDTAEPVHDCEHHPLGKPLRPGASRRIELRLCAPLAPGDYFVRIGPIVETIGRLSDFRPGNEWTGTVRVEAAGVAAQDAGVSQSPA